MTRKLASSVLAVLLGVFLSVPLVRAASFNETGNQQIVLTVRKTPIELPGIVLGPGKYVIFFDFEGHALVTIASGKSIGMFDVSRVSRNNRVDRHSGLARYSTLAQERSTNLAIRTHRHHGWRKAFPNIAKQSEESLSTARSHPMVRT